MHGHVNIKITVTVVYFCSLNFCSGLKVNFIVKIVAKL